MAAPASDFLMKKKIKFTPENFTTENFTLLQKILLHEKYFSTKLVSIKIPFTIRKSIFFTILILIDVLQYE